MNTFLKLISLHEVLNVIYIGWFLTCQWFMIYQPKKISSKWKCLMKSVCLHSEFTFNQWSKMHNQSLFQRLSSAQVCQLAAVVTTTDMPYTCQLSRGYMAASQPPLPCNSTEQCYPALRAQTLWFQLTRDKDTLGFGRNSSTTVLK